VVVYLNLSPPMTFGTAIGSSFFSSSFYHDIWHSCLTIVYLGGWLQSSTKIDRHIFLGLRSLVLSKQEQRRKFQNTILKFDFNTLQPPNELEKERIIYKYLWLLRLLWDQIAFINCVLGNQIKKMAFREGTWGSTTAEWMFVISCGTVLE